MESTTEKLDDQPHRSLPQFRTDSATLYTSDQANSSLDSGIETGDQSSSSANHDASATNGTTDSSSAPSFMEAQLAEEQELTPDVRTVTVSFASPSAINDAGESSRLAMERS